MKTIEFRLLEGDFVWHCRNEKYRYRIQVKKWYGCKYVVSFSAFGENFYPKLDTEQQCIDSLYSDEKLKPELITLIQHPTIKVTNP